MVILGSGDKVLWYGSFVRQPTWTLELDSGESGARVR